MAALTADQIPDLTATTRPLWERGRWTDISTDLRELHVFRNLILFKDENKKATRFETREGGTSFNFNLMINHMGAASNVSLNPQDAPVDNDVMETATAPWRASTCQWWISQQAAALNRGDQQMINNYETTKEKAAMISLALLMESNFWGAPVASTDDVTPYSLFTWLPKGSVAGFNGGFPSGFTTLGLDNEHPRWKHYVAQYTDLTATDGIRKVWRAMEYTMFMNPVDGIPNLDAGLDRALYMNTETYISACEQAKLQNDSVGYDLHYSATHGGPMMSGVLLKKVPRLDSDTTDPIICLDWSTFKCIAIRDWWLRRLVIKNYPGQHLSDAYFYDLMYQFICYNRRKNAVVAKGTTYPS